MFMDIQKAVAAEYSGARAKDLVAQISQYHRIQASPGFRAAAQRCYELLAGFDVSAEVLSFPADERTHYWGQQMFQEWDASEATLHLIQPTERAHKLADLNEIPCSLIQRSVAVDNVEADVAVLEDGEEEAEYANLDLRGKVVLTRGNVARVSELAVGKFGALGILFDGMRDCSPVRQRIDLPDARQYTSFWWRPGAPKCFGFVLSPRQGEDLRKWIKEAQRDNKPPVRVRARVVSRLYDGRLEVVSALIPGESDEEVVVVAHLCHPKPSANDNASGSAALLELARTLQHLISTGQLARPKRGIRLLWVPEMTGTYAYLATHEDEIPHMVAGLNLDMVGQDQQACGSIFVVERPPAAAPSFAADLLERLREAWMSEVPNLAGLMAYPLFRHAVSPFSGGSDHYVLSDPTVGIPAPMLIQWPDKFYHTSEDTLDKVDPHMLAVVGGLATTYAYFVANAGSQEVQWLGHEMNAHYRMSLVRHIQDDLTEALATRKAEDLAVVTTRMEKQARFCADRQCAALLSLTSLSSQVELLLEHLRDEVNLIMSQELERARGVILEHAHGLGLGAIPAVVSTEPDEWERRAATLVPQRRFRGPVSAQDYLYQLPTEEREEAHNWLRRVHELYDVISISTYYWVDGRRTAAQIADLVELETGKRDVQLMLKYLDLMSRLNLISLQAR